MLTKRRFSTLFVPMLVAATLAAGEANPPAEGFDLEGSDAEAIALADSTMEAMGGRAAWDATRFITWKFFGRRMHAWDKHTGDIRIEGVGREDGKPYMILMNLHDNTGRAWRDGEEIVEAEALAEMIESGESAWINDSYWIAMPYKLKDSGVTLKSLGEGTMLDGRTAQRLELTFHDVGRTPENKYHVYIADDTGLVEQWDFYADAADAEPGFQIPWHNWQGYGDILLSDDRGKAGHELVGVYDELPESVFASPEPVDWEALVGAE